MKDYNISAHLGITDQDYVEEFDMPASLAGTPEMNDWMIQHVYDGNIKAEAESRMSEGMDPSQATAEAIKFADKARKDAQRNLAQVTKQRGY